MWSPVPVPPLLSRSLRVCHTALGLLLHLLEVHTLLELPFHLLEMVDLCCQKSTAFARIELLFDFFQVFDLCNQLRAAPARAHLGCIRLAFPHLGAAFSSGQFQVRIRYR